MRELLLRSTTNQAFWPSWPASHTVVGLHLLPQRDQWEHTLQLPRSLLICSKHIPMHALPSSVRIKFDNYLAGTTMSSKLFSLSPHWYWSISLSFKRFSYHRISIRFRCPTLLTTLGRDNHRSWGKIACSLKSGMISAAAAEHYSGIKLSTRMRQRKQAR